MKHPKRLPTDAKPTLRPKLRFPEFRDGPEWVIKQLDDLLESITSGLSLPQGSSDRGLKVTRIETIADRSIDLSRIGYLVTEQDVSSYKLEIGDILFSNINSLSHIGKTAYIDQDHDLYHGMNLLRLVVDRSANSPDFVFRLVNTESVRSSIRARANKAVNQASINQSELAKTVVATPGRAEQQKIAECLRTLDELVAAESQKLDALKAHRNRLMQQLLPREGEALPQIRFAEFQNASEWEERTLAGIAEIRSGTTPARANPEYYVGGSIPWVKTTDLNNSFITNTEESVTPLAKVRVNPVGSILIAMYGGFNQIGRTGCLSIPSATNQAISVLVVDRTKARPAYVLAWLNAKVSTWKRIASSSRKDPNITGADVARFSIYLPQISEQDRIVSCLSSLDELIAAQVNKLGALMTHKQGLMQQLFPSTPEAD